MIIAWLQEAATVMEHKLCRSVQSAHMVLHDQGVLANAILGALVRASDEAQLAEQVFVMKRNLSTHQYYGKMRLSRHPAA